MQSVNAAFTAEEKDSTRKIAQSTLISWHKENLTTRKAFTIGVSTIGGNDGIASNPGALGSPGNYRYFDESSYVTGIGWERGYSMPLGGLTKALAEIHLDNTSGRFTPRYMGGYSELFTAQPLHAPVIINAGFNFGVDQTVPQFAGVVTDQPNLSVRGKTYDVQAADYIDYFQNKYLDQAVMFTAQRTDQVLTTLSTQLGMNTAQYDYDTGINIIPFGYFPAGTKFSDAFSQLVEAENGHYYQDESGIFKFENRQHWNSSPYTTVQKVITTSQVIDANAPDQSHLVNVVEINSNIRTKQQQDIIFRLDVTNPLLIDANSTQDLFINFDDPVLAMTSPTSGGTVSYFIGNSNSDGSGTDLSNSITFTLNALFANSAKFRVGNSSSQGVYITSLVVSGRTAKVTTQLYYRAKDGSSVTAYNEQSISINNDFISSQDWASSYAQMILNDFSSPENIQKITVRAIPELQLGDLISWQGNYWRIFDIKVTLDASMGFIQELLLLQRSVVSYFRIGISTIGGNDKISP